MAPTLDGDLGEFFAALTDGQQQIQGLGPGRAHGGNSNCTLKIGIKNGNRRTAAAAEQVVGEVHPELMRVAPPIPVRRSRKHPAWGSDQNIKSGLELWLETYWAVETRIEDAPTPLAVCHRPPPTARVVRGSFLGLSARQPWTPVCWAIVS